MPELTEFLDILKNAGAGVVPLLAFFLWRTSREKDAIAADLKEANAELIETGKEMVQAISDMRNSIATITDGAAQSREVLNKIYDAVTILSVRRPRG